jgi:hypothetical protein
MEKRVAEVATRFFLGVRAALDSSPELWLCKKANRLSNIPSRSWRQKR